jgi:uncharacterized protein YhaN
MFGIDHAALRQGGQEIAQGGGQLGTTLFSSASGLAGLRAVQARFTDTIDRVFKPSGRSGTLVDGINKYKSKKDLQKETQVSADAYNKHVDSKNKAVESRKKLDQEIYTKQIEKSRLERIANSVQAIASLRKAKMQLGEVADATLLPEDFLATCSKLVAELQNLEHRKKSKKADIDAIDLQLQCLARAGINLLDRIQHGEVEGFLQGCAPWAEIKPFFQADLQIFVAFWSGGCTTPLVVTRCCIGLLGEADTGGQHLKQA